MENVAIYVVTEKRFLRMVLVRIAETLHVHRLTVMEDKLSVVVMIVHLTIFNWELMLMVPAQNSVLNINHAKVTSNAEKIPG